MATLSVWKFDTAEGAAKAEGLLEQLQTEALIKVHDAAIVFWPEGSKKPKHRELHSLAGVGALGGAFWGLLFGIIFFIPLLGLVVGAAAGAAAGAMSHVGIDEGFVNDVRSQVTPGTSALFVYTSDAVPDKVLERVKEAGLHAELVHTNLSNEQEQKLREAFSEEGAAT